VILQPARGMSWSNGAKFTLSAFSSTLSAQDDAAGDHYCVHAQGSAIAYKINRSLLLRGAARYRWLLLARSK